MAGLPEVSSRAGGPALSLLAATGSAAVLIGLLIGAAAAHYGLANLALTKDQADFWNIFLKGVAGLLGLVAGIIATSKFLDEKAQQSRAAFENSRKPLIEKRQSVYAELLNSTGTIGNTHEGKEPRLAAEAAFWRIYWSTAPMVYDIQVAAALDYFHHVLLNMPGNGDALRIASMELAHACRRSLGFESM